ncbi:hypothetical protein [Methanolobus sp.]|uniref:hypothetical protein n=1 Tax=Methanolobus sp. TaxID=1874737 RepID=UPI0025F3138A|nr:hypothetical protein [Methanolobus sp.]
MTTMPLILELSLFVLFTTILAAYVEHKYCIFDKIMRIKYHILNPEVEIRFFTTYTSNVPFANLKPILISTFQNCCDHIRVDKNSNHKLEILVDSSYCVSFQAISNEEIYFQSDNIKMKMNSMVTVAENMLSLLDNIAENIISKNYACNVNNYTVHLCLPFKKLICRNLVSNSANAHAYKFVMYNEGYSNEMLAFEDLVRIKAKKKDDLLKLMELFT